MGKIVSNCLLLCQKVIGSAMLKSSQERRAKRVGAFANRSNANARLTHQAFEVASSI